MEPPRRWNTFLLLTAQLLRWSLVQGQQPTPTPTIFEGYDFAQCVIDVSESDRDGNGFISRTGNDPEYLELIKRLGSSVCFEQTTPLTAAQQTAFFGLVCDVVPDCRYDSSELPVNGLSNEQLIKICTETKKSIFTKCPEPTASPTFGDPTSPTVSLPTRAPTLGRPATPPIPEAPTPVRSSAPTPPIPSPTPTPPMVGNDFHVECGALVLVVGWSSARVSHVFALFFSILPCRQPSSEPGTLAPTIPFEAVAPGVSLAQCREDLSAADADNNDRITRQEFVTFLETFGDRVCYERESEGSTELSDTESSVFDALVCLVPEADECDDLTEIDVSLPAFTPSIAYLLCTVTYSSAMEASVCERAVETTTEPTAAPVVTTSDAFSVSVGYKTLVVAGGAATAMLAYVWM